MANPLFDLTGRSALVTGAGSGIGAAVARTLAATGAAVLVSDVMADAAATVAQRICADGGKAAHSSFSSPTLPPTSPVRCCRWTAAW